MNPVAVNNGCERGQPHTHDTHTHSHSHSHSHGGLSAAADGHPGGRPEPSPSALLWTRAGLLVLLAVVLHITVSFCTGIYFDRESAFRSALRCSEAVLAEAGVDHWLQNGTLLGATRLGRLISWDADLDFGVLLPDAAGMNAVGSELDARCFGFRSSVRAGVANMAYRVWRKCTNRLCAEFHEARLQGGPDENTAVVVTGDGQSPVRELLPLASCVVAEVTSFCPNNAPFFLAQAYGSAWMTKPLIKLF